MLFYHMIITENGRICDKRAEMIYDKRAEIWALEAELLDTYGQSLGFQDFAINLQFVVGAFENCTFALIVDDTGNFFGLGGRILQVLDQAFDYMLKGVDIVIPKDKLMGGGQYGQHFIQCKNFFLGFD